jgi:hypothetical protein
MKRTLARLRQLGYVADIVERRLPGCYITRDLFSFADILAIHPGDRVIMLVQTTKQSNFAKRLRHVREQPAVPMLLDAGVCIEVWAWKKCEGRWHARREAVQPETLETVVVAELPDGRRRRQPSLRKEEKNKQAV